MGIYLCGVDAGDWADPEVYGGLAGALGVELGRRGVPVFGAWAEPAVGFEEKMSRPIEGFEALCRAQPGGAGVVDALLGWELLVPAGFSGVFELSVPGPYSDVTTVGSARGALEAARGLAVRLGLPPQVPRDGGSLALTNWFDSTEAAAAAVSHPGPWAEDPDTAFYAAVHLRAAEHSVRWSCPMTYS
ncbi:hypothetical protein ACIQUQ_13640 [Streptomyces sp. NPDC101118]|uniref:hypothetical protein n=1 Tax=Streptomyces sp. NPDC101118 TaxID=3366109 RepID=UPI00382DE91E